MANTKKATNEKPRPLVVEATKDETQAQTMARVVTGPYLRHGVVANGLADKMIGKLPGEPRFDDYAHELKKRAETTGKGDLTLVSEILTAQALTLDSMFTELARRASLNMGDYLDAMDRYARLALKAQANSRTTLEALAKLHQPREQTVKHVHVNEGGQAVVADNFHQHRGHGENGKSVKQSDATGATGECAALPCPDSEGHGVPIPSRKRKAALQNARRNESGRA
ncbi:hypothetical protein [Sphingomonas daechungensis]|uniref:hypothetical protein n=1 Tax=Sphingomonas daechungensis TaxID=1176646 RepID=UPI00378402A4